MRYTLDIHFVVSAEKDAFLRRFSHVRDLLSRGKGIDNLGLMSAMFDIVEGIVPSTATAGNEHQTVQSFLKNSGRLVCLCVFTYC